MPSKAELDKYLNAKIEEGISTAAKEFVAREACPAGAAAAATGTDLTAEHEKVNYALVSFNEKGVPIEDFILNTSPFNNSEILIAGKNFGCGSSREHAPWALLDFGITCVVSSSYADIFYNNCFKNGILPIVLPEAKIKELSEYSKRKEEIIVNLEEQKITFGNNEIDFEIDQFKKKCLLEGLDDIALSLEKNPKITEFEKKLSSNKPWIFND